MVAAPAFAIRKPAVAVFTLDDYAGAGIMTANQAAALRYAVTARKNILVAGGTSTGKTTLTNALLAEIAGTTDRVVLIEDTRELQCRAPNLVALRTKDGVASLSDLVRSSLRLRPDRIPIGEVRGAEALDLLKAWGTGHPGGIGTIHAGTALGALRRLEQLIQEAVVTVPKALIAETIDLVAVLRGRGADRRLAELATVAGLDPATGDYRVLSAVVDPCDPARQDRGGEAADQDPAAVVRQARVDRRHRQGGDDQRGLDAGRLRCSQQGGGCRPRLAGAGLRRCRASLCHRFRHRLGRGRRSRGREAPPRGEGDSGPRLHLHAGRGECAGGVARLAFPAMPTPTSVSRRSRR